jgi:hypothetical protein
VSWPSDGAPHFPGEIVAREIHEQPDALLGLLEHEPEYASDAGATIVASGSAAEEIHTPYVLPVPAAPMPLLAPLLSVVPRAAVRRCAIPDEGLRRRSAGRPQQGHDRPLRASVRRRPGDAAAPCPA